MGIFKKALDVLIKLREDGYIPDRASVIEMGAQQLTNDFLEASDQLEKIGRQFGAPLPHPLPPPTTSLIMNGGELQDPGAPPASLFWKWLGFNYKAVDIDGTFDSVQLDLNYDDVPAEEHGAYTLVTNFGTTEHVANQLNAFKIMHDLTALGGLMMHTVPAQGLMNHGLINYNPKFYWMLARSNGYKWLYVDYLSAASYYALPSNVVDHMKQFNPDIAERGKDYQMADTLLIIVLQKVFDTPYVAPLDVPTGSKTQDKLLEERYWSVFKANSFEKFGG